MVVGAAAVGVAVGTVKAVGMPVVAEAEIDSAFGDVLVTLSEAEVVVEVVGWM